MDPLAKSRGSPVLRLLPLSIVKVELAEGNTKVVFITVGVFALPFILKLHERVLFIMFFSTASLRITLDLLGGCLAFDSRMEEKKKLCYLSCYSSCSSRVGWKRLPLSITPPNGINIACTNIIYFFFIFVSLLIIYHLLIFLL